MRINCISFLRPDVYGGGGEMISRRLLDTGRSRRHDIRISSARPCRVEIHAKPELVVFIDVFNHGHSARSLGAWRGFSDSFIEDQMASAPFVHLSNAYTDVCNLPYLPCSGASSPACPMKPVPILQRLILRDGSVRCFATAERVRKLYENAALNVFLSPLHRSVTEHVLGRSLSASFILKPMIDTDIFRNEHQERDIEYLFVGVIGEAKGLDEMRKRFGDTDIHLIGRLAPGATVDFGRHIPHVPYAAVPKWMNRARNFVFLPRWPEPQGRVVAEAALCGCRIIANDRVGALSFDFDLANPVNYGSPEGELWRALEDLA